VDKETPFGLLFQVLPARSQQEHLKFHPPASTVSMLQIEGVWILKRFYKGILTPRCQRSRKQISTSTLKTWIGSGMWDFHRSSQWNLAHISNRLLDGNRKQYPALNSDQSVRNGHQSPRSSKNRPPQLMHSAESITGQSFIRRAAIGAAGRHGNFPRTAVHSSHRPSNLNSTGDADLLTYICLLKSKVGIGSASVVTYIQSENFNKDRHSSRRQSLEKRN
jgi:hypothetical protein